jgi:ZIP family zinc transporter
MVDLVALAFVFLAGLVTALATGLGAIPFFLYDDVSDAWNVALWGLASGIMLAASLFGLVDEGLAESPETGVPWLLVAGLLAGVALVVVANRVLENVNVGGHDGEPEPADPQADGGGHEAHQGGHSNDQGHNHAAEHAHAEDHAQAAEHAHAEDHAQAAEHAHAEDHAHPSGHAHDDGHDHGFDPAAFAEADLKKLVLILGVLTVHSFPEGVAVGVSFAELGFEGGVAMFGLSVPVLAIFMTVAISIHNVPEGLAISIPLRAMDVGEWRMVGAAVFSSLPQPIGAVIAFAFVRWAREFLPFGFGFAAGAMIYLVLSEFVPEALEAGTGLPRGGKPQLAVGLLAGVLLMLPLLYVG